MPSTPRSWLAPDVDHSARFTKGLHARRVERLMREPDALADADVPAPDSTPELAAAWRELQLHWLATEPEYRAEVRQRVSDAAKRADARARKIETSQRTLDGGRLSDALKLQHEREDQLDRLAGY